MMDAAGVDLQVSASPQLPSFLEESHAAEAARHVNDLYARVVRDHPDRFAAFAALPLPHVEVALHELRRALDDLGMIGATVSTSTLGRSVADPAWDPIFDDWRAHRGHGLDHAPDHPQIPSRYSNMKIINSHLGGALPMLIQRMDDQYHWEAPETPERRRQAHVV